MSFINRFSIMRNFIIFIFCSMNYPLHNKKALISRLFIIPICQRFLGFYEQSNTLSGLLLPHHIVTTFLTLRQLSHGQNICFYFDDKSSRTSSDTTSTCVVCPLRIQFFVLVTVLRTQFIWF